jgi:hypothetical protein
MNRVSIVMAVFNGERFLPAQLESLATQTVLPHELIVANDCSSDGSAAIVKAFAETAQFPVRLVEHPRNVGYARNFMSATALVSGDVIAFCDQDDVWSPEKVQMLADAITSSANEVFYHDLSIQDDRRQVTLSSYFGLLEERGLRRSLCIKGCATAVRKSFLDRWGWPTDPALNISHDLWIALLATALQCREYIDVPLTLHRIHRHNLSGWLPSIVDSQFFWTTESLSQASDLLILMDFCVKRHNIGVIDALLAVLQCDEGSSAAQDLMRRHQGQVLRAAQ